MGVRSSVFRGLDLWLVEGSTPEIEFRLAIAMSLLLLVCARLRRHDTNGKLTGHCVSDSREILVFALVCLQAIGILSVMVIVVSIVAIILCLLILYTEALLPEEIGIFGWYI